MLPRCTDMLHPPRELLSSDSEDRRAAARVASPSSSQLDAATRELFEASAKRRALRRLRPTASSSASSSSSSSSDERGISDDEFDDPDLEAKFRRMLETPEGREAVDAERARAERLVDRRERERYEAWRRRRRRRQSGGGGFLSTLATLATLPLKVSFGVIRWGWNRWRRPEAAGDGSDVV